MTQHLSPGQEAVLRTFDQFGPLDDVGLAYFVHHKSPEDMSSSGVRTRRSELVRLGLVGVTGTTRAKSGRMAAIHGITTAGKRVVKALDRVAV